LTTCALDSIVLGDCLELLRDLPKHSVDLVVSSPPYNIGKEYESRQHLAAYLGQQRAVLAECVRVLKPTGSLFWQVGAYSNGGMLIPLDVRFFPMLEDLGMYPRNRIIWVRQHGLHGQKKFSARHETILWFTKSHEYKFFLDPIRVPQKYQNKKSWRGENKGELTCNPLGKNPGDVWIFRNVKHNHEEQTIHPAQFPEDMIARIILSTTEQADVVLDPYMGVGTVAVVARDHGRHYMGAEVDKDYHNVALRRISGMPDASGCFPNLKTLRDYAEATGIPTSNYSFDMQVGRVAGDRSKAKIFPESYHLDELERRLTEEETAFAERVRGTSAPEPQTSKRHLAGVAVPALFDEIEMQAD
jgi:adenine-specific DNA-methyltransferase